MTSSIGVMDAILVETEKRRRGSRPGRVRGSIDARWRMLRGKEEEEEASSSYRGVRRASDSDSEVWKFGGFPRNFIHMTSTTLFQLPLCLRLGLEQTRHETMIYSC
jgi:hypothetical protein